MEDMKFELVDAVPSTSEINVPVENNLDKAATDAESKVTLKRKSDSLALISSYQISSESEEDMKRDAFLKPQILSETDSESDTDSDSDGLPVFNVDSDAASESGDEGISSGVKQKKSSRNIKAPGELDIDDLPPIKDLQISVKEEECLPFGKVHSIVETLVVIEALPDVPAINLESVLFTKIGQALGEIFDVFGPVKRPYYTIRFNNRNEIESKSLSVGTLVYCAPKTKYTQYVFIHQLAKMKGSDASWKGDMEPPPGYEEYSDDEEERKAKKERKESRMKALAQEIVDLDEPVRKVPSFEERMNRQNTMRNQLFSNHLTTPPKRPDWFRNAAPGAGRPMPDGEGSSKGNIVRASNFTVPPFHRQAPPTPPSFPFFSPGGRSFSIRNNQMQSKFFPSPSTSNIFPPQNQMNGNPFSTNRPQASFSSNGPSFPTNAQGFQTTNSGFQGNCQKFPSQNFSPQNSQPFQRNAPPFRPLVGGFSSNNQSWPSNNHTFGAQPSFPANTHSFPSPSFGINNSPGFSQNHPCKHRHFDNQGQQFPMNSTCGSGNIQQNGFMAENPPFLPPSNKPFPQMFPPNCPQYPAQQGQNFQPPQHPGNPPFHLPNSRSFAGSSPSFQSQNRFSSPNQQPPQFIQKK